METTAALGLADRITACWRGPEPSEWIEELELMDEGPAGTAFARLRREHSGRWLSIAEFVAAYRAVDPHDRSTRVVCELCRGDGWVPLLDKHYVTAEVGYTAAEPCPACAQGRAARESRAWRDGREVSIRPGAPPTVKEKQPLPPLPALPAEPRLPYRGDDTP